MVVDLPKGRLWYSAAPTAELGPIEMLGADVVASRLVRPFGKPVPHRFAALRSADFGAGGGSYFVLLGAELRGSNAPDLSVEVAFDRRSAAGRIDRSLAECVLRGATDAAATIDACGTLSFRWAAVHAIDCRPHRYRQAAQVLTILLGTIESDAAPAIVARHARELWELHDLRP